MYYKRGRMWLPIVGKDAQSVKISTSYPEVMVSIRAPAARSLLVWQSRRLHEVTG